MPVIREGQVSPNLRSLFSVDLPTGVRCWAILTGQAAGRVLADDPLQPRWAIVQELAGGTIYLGGSLTAPILSEVIRVLREEREVVAGLWPDDPRWQLLPPDPYYDGKAIDFTDRPAGDDLSRFLSLPEGCRMQPVDGSLLPRLASYAWTVSIFGSPEKALEKGLGCCLMQDDTILSEALADAQADGLIEIGVYTHEPYRGRGYATLTCAHLIRACEARGFYTFWNAAAQNRASVALARRLGYRTEREFRVLAWSPVPFPAEPE